MTPFAHRSRAQRIVFGPGARRGVPDELDALGARRVLVISGGSALPAARAVADAAGKRVAGTVAEVRQHVPEELARRAVDAATRLDADHLLCVGGGSATGLAKAVAVELGLPIVALPTTYAGSEMTAVWGVTGDRKRTGHDERALPATVVYDPELTVDLPPRASAASGMNAVAQGVAALVHEPEDPIATLQAAAGVRGLAAALPEVVGRPRDVDARGRALYAACLAARGMAGSGTGLHHRLAHLLGGRFRAVHADVHAILLPHTTARMRRLAPAGWVRLCAALDVDDPAAALHDLAERIGAPTRLADAGLDEATYPSVAAEAADDRITAAEVHRLLLDAHRGQPSSG